MRLRSTLVAALAIAILAPVSGIASESGAVIWPDARAREKAERLRDADATDDVVQELAISRTLIVNARFSITSKGNGILSLPGLTVRVYDEHDDGITFRGGLLTCEWHQQPGQRYLDLIVSGIAERHDEKGNHIADTAVRAIFRYAPQERRFIPITCSPEIDYWSSER